MAPFFSFVGALEFAGLPQQLVNGLLLGSMYALIALGYTMVYGVLRLINFAHGEVFMLGAYSALFMSWWLGFTPEATRGQTLSSSPLNLLWMLLFAMAVCAAVGVLIERFAYRPMRNQARIASLITAIGVSLLLQFGGALLLPVSPPPSISEQVNPYRGSTRIVLKGPGEALKRELAAAQAELEEAREAFRVRFERERAERGIVNEFQLSPEGRVIRNARLEAERKVRDVENAIRESSVQIIVPNGQLIMFCTSLVLMLLLRQLVLKTRTGRAMRAAAHDFTSAQLMGINVNQIVTITFLIGSALAGAGAMMNATFLGTPLTSFYGIQPGVKAFVAAVLGGIGNIPGAVLGGVLMGMAETMVVWAGGSGYRDAIAFVILIAVLLLRPGGLLGSAKVEKV